LAKEGAETSFVGPKPAYGMCRGTVRGVLGDLRVENTQNIGNL